MIWLQGLNENWQIVWWAGFNPDQIEEVGPKPCSQYDWTRETLKTKCPYPILQRNDRIAMGPPR
jgi:hypothetical protein